MITDAGQVLYATAANQDDRVLLKVVPDTRDISRNLYPIRKTHAGNLAKSRVRLLWRNRINARTNPPALRIFLERWSGRACPLVLAAIPDKL
jgi:hypothetical protein